MHRAAILLFSLNLLATQGEPKIFCAKPFRLFGRMEKGSRATHTFLIENQGDAPLKITAVQASCDCTTAPLVRQHLEPGASMPLEVQLDSTSLDGEVEKVILVASDDPVRPLLPLFLRANVQNPYLHPGSIHLDSIGRNSEMEVRVPLSRMDGKPLKIRSVSILNDSDFGARFERTPGTASACDVVLRLKAGALLHTVNAQLVVALEDSILPALHIPILGQIVEDVSIYPQNLEFGEVRLGSELRRRVLVTLYNPKVELVTPFIEPEGFMVEVLPRKPLAPVGSQVDGKPGVGTGMGLTPRAYEIRIRARAGAKIGPYRGQIEIRTTGPEETIFRLPLTGILTVE